LMAQHSKLKLEIQLSAELVDLVTQGLDLAIRLGDLPDSRLVARKLTEFPLIVVASPRYLRLSSDSRPAPVAPAALAHHDCIVHTSWRDPRWHFVDEEGAKQIIAVGGRWRFDDGTAAVAAAIDGHGVTMQPRFMVEEGLRRGDLVQLLEGYRSRAMPLHAVYLGSRRHIARVETLVQALLRHFQPHTIA
jgi:DNA-binding transcriptional LysR family regulator